jgi:Transposase DDE domain
MDAFTRELMRRSPLAASVLEACDYMFDDQLLASIWEHGRGRCYEDTLTFDALLRLMRDALIRHGGSAHQLFVELESDNKNPVDESNFYRKLSRTPADVSRGLLSGCTQRLALLMPQTRRSLPGCFDGFELIIADGKKIKNATKRLKPARGYQGALLGATALVALNLRSGMAIAFSDSLDGMTNDVPLVCELMPQLYELFPDRPILTIWDRQFDDVRTFGRLSTRPQDAWIVRVAQMKTPFAAEESVKTVDSLGRAVLDEVGLLGKEDKAMRVRRITLFRDNAAGEENIVVQSNLLDRRRYPAADLLGLYRERWGIEQAFQQVTQTFSLEHLIGSSPKATLLQFSFCLLLYNLMQLIRAWVADNGQVLASTVSLFYLFNDCRKELEAWAYHTDGSWPRTHRTAAQMRQRLAQLLEDIWDPIRYTKNADKRPRPKPKPKQRLHGGYSSMQRVLEGRARVIESQR